MNEISEEIYQITDMLTKLKLSNLELEMEELLICSLDKLNYILEEIE